VVDFFSDAEEGAESFEDRVDKATDSVFRLRDATQDPIRLGLEQARQSVELLSDDLNELREIRERLLSPSSPEFAAAAGAVGTPSGSKLEPRPTEALEALRERETISEKTQDRLDKIIQQRKDLNTLLRAQRRTLAESSEITKAQVRQIQEGTASTEALVTASEEGVVRFRRLSRLADDLLGRYQSVNQLLQGQNRLVDENLVTQEQVTEELASRLEDAENIEQVQQRLNTAVEDGLITRKQMQAVMEDIRSDTKDTTDEAEELAEAQRRINRAVEQEVIAREKAKTLVEDLGTSNDQIARSTAEALGNVEDLRAQMTDLAGPQGKALAKARRTKEQFQGQVEALRNVNRILARREEGIQAEQVMPAGLGSLGETPPVLQSIQDLSGQSNVLKQYAQRLREARIQAQELAEALEDIKLAGSDRELGRTPEGVEGALQQTPGLGAASSSIEEIQNQFDVGEQKARQFKDQAKQQVGQIINAASQLGSALGQAFSDGEKSAKDFVSIVLQGVGGILSAIPGVGQVAGPLLGGVGSIVGSFQEGGLVRGEGGTTEDRIPAMLSDKEFVVQAASAQMAPGALQAMNKDPTLAAMIEQLITSQNVEQSVDGGMIGADSVLSVMAEGGEARGRGGSTDDQTAALRPLGVAAAEFSKGGKVRGPGGPTDDQIPAWLSHQEFVVQAESAMQAPTAMEAMNENPALAGMVEQMFVGQSPQEFASGGFAAASAGPPSSTIQVEQDLQTTPPKRERSIQLETEVKRLNKRELALLVRTENERRTQFQI
jgi:hypothetical protein